MQTPLIDHKLEASRLVNLYATKSAALTAATADVRAELTAATASLNKIEAPLKAELDAIEAQAKALALEHGPAIFGDMRSLTENGFKLGLTAVEEVEMDADEATVCRIVLAELRSVEQQIAEAKAADDHAKVQSLTYHRLALTSLLSVKYSINKTYVKDNADDSADWFEGFGIRVVDRDSASLKKAPPPKATKAKTKKSTTLKTTEPAAEQEAA